MVLNIKTWNLENACILTSKNSTYKLSEDFLLKHQLCLCGIEQIEPSLVSVMANKIHLSPVMPPLCIHRALRAQIDGLNFVSISRFCILIEHTRSSICALLKICVF